MPDNEDNTEGANQWFFSRWYDSAASTLSSWRAKAAESWENMQARREHARVMAIKETDVYIEATKRWVGEQKQAVETAIAGMTDANAELSAEKATLESQLEKAQAETKSAKAGLEHARAINTRQADITQHLYSRLVMSERLVMSGTTAPVLFVDSELRVSGVSPSFTEKFGYTAEDLTVALPELKGLPEGDVDHSRIGAPLEKILSNPQNVQRLHVLNTYFHPESRDQCHYELCLVIKPKTAKRGMLSWISKKEAEPQDAYCIGYATVAIKDRQFLGASFEIREMGRRELKQIAVGYIANPEASVTAAEHVTAELAEGYRRAVLGPLYTHDPTKLKRIPKWRKDEARKDPAPEPQGNGVIDLIATKVVDSDAVDIFRELYEFCNSWRVRETVTLAFANLNSELRTQFFNAGIPLSAVYGTPKKEQAYDSGLEGELAPEPAV